jgi:hypothetical protein
MRPAIAGAACAAALLIGCGAADEQHADTAASHLNCPRWGARPTSVTFVADRVAFDRSGAAQGAPRQTTTAEDGRSFSKVGLYVRGNVSVRLRVPREVPASVDIRWDSKGPSRTVLIRQRLTGTCADVLWMGHAGGVLFDGQLCLPLVVEVAGQRRTVTFGLKRDCSAA